MRAACNNLGSYRSAAQGTITDLTACLLAGAYPNHATLTISNNVLNGSSFTPLMVWLINTQCSLTVTRTRRAVLIFTWP